MISCIILHFPYGYVAYDKQGSIINNKYIYEELSQWVTSHGYTIQSLNSLVGTEILSVLTPNQKKDML